MKKKKNETQNNYLCNNFLIKENNILSQCLQLPIV